MPKGYGGSKSKGKGKRGGGGGMRRDTAPLRGGKLKKRTKKKGK